MTAWDDMTIKEKILTLARDVAGPDLLYYGRKDDEDMPRGAIEDAIQSGAVTADEIAAELAAGFKSYLAASMEEDDESSKLGREP